MTLAVVPDDWANEYKYYLVQWPNSGQYKAILRGLLTLACFEDFYDKFTGDNLDARLAILETLDFNLDLNEGAMIPTGVVVDYAGGTIPEGWLLCDGSELNRADYADLFSAIGTLHGVGNGTTTFNLPVSAGRVSVGVDIENGLMNVVGDKGGDIEAVIEIVNLPPHSHTQNSHTHTQDSHNHTQNSHTHTQDSHNHTQNSHQHLMDLIQTAPTGGTQRVVTIPGSANVNTQGTTATNIANTATNQNTTPTNQSTTATNQSTTATNVNTGGGEAISILQPFIAYNKIIKV